MLAARGVEFSYGNTPVLVGVDIEVRAGELVALIGTNGAGKSTLLELLVGLLRPAAGRITLDGEDVSALGPAGMIERGVVLVQGGRGVFPDLTVLENLEVGLHSLHLGRRAVRSRAEAALERVPALARAAHRSARTLSGGEQQLLAMAKGLELEPRLLLVDELTLGLSPDAAERMVATVIAVHGSGTTVLVVDQSLEVASALAPRAVFLDKGAVRFDGPMTQVLERHDLARAVFITASGP